MAKRLILKENGLAGSSNAPDGYKYLGDDGGNISEKVGATATPIGGLQTQRFVFRGFFDDPINPTGVQQNTILDDNGNIAVINFSNPLSNTLNLQFTFVDTTILMNKLNIQFTHYSNSDSETITVDQNNSSIIIETSGNAPTHYSLLVEKFD